MEKITVSPEDKTNFDLVMAYQAMDSAEIEACKTAYRSDPEASKRFYAERAAIIRWKKPILNGNWVNARDMVINLPTKAKRA
jgi:hypothetical protein